MDHAIWVFVHVMLLVYWLGADLGVFLLAKAAKRAELPFAERAFALHMAVRIDLVPRLCFTVMFPVGLHVTASGGFAVIPAWAFVIAWLVSLAWIALLVTLGRNEGKPLAARLNRWHLGLQAVLLVIIGAIGASSWLGHGPLPGGWFAAKIVLFALIFAMGIGIDFAFRPIGPAFVRLASEGSKPDIENTISVAVDGAIRYVLGLYALLIAIAFLGITKFL
ncbi:MAG: hypothetical protein FJ154_03010 [Gammaproteobacteria bacterium]|nr:hypothetical protein [Gammaproteobacteria bacterium]